MADFSRAYEAAAGCIADLQVQAGIAGLGQAVDFLSEFMMMNDMQKFRGASQQVLVLYSE